MWSAFAVLGIIYTSLGPLFFIFYVAAVIYKEKREQKRNEPTFCRKISGVKLEPEVATFLEAKELERRWGSF